DRAEVRVVVPAPARILAGIDLVDVAAAIGEDRAIHVAVDLRRAVLVRIAGLVDRDVAGERAPGLELPELRAGERVVRVDQAAALVRRRRLLGRDAGAGDRDEAGRVVDLDPRHRDLVLRLAGARAARHVVPQGRRADDRAGGRVDRLRDVERGDALAAVAAA